ncbi:MAG: putative transposase [Saprospiraceae bacterium]|jgi:putative transposase
MKYHAKYNKNNKLHQFWKRDNHPVELISKKWIGRRIEYTHNNPVRAGFVDNQTAYIYSSSRDYIGEEGILDIDVLDMESLV